MIETRRVDSTLALDAPTLAKIFNGTITRWDDPAITRLNQSMPSQPITLVYRSDDSGTSETFQRYLTHRRMGCGARARAGLGTAAWVAPLVSMASLPLQSRICGAILQSSAAYGAVTCQVERTIGLQLAIECAPWAKLSFAADADRVDVVGGVVSRSSVRRSRCVIALPQPGLAGARFVGPRRTARCTSGRCRRSRH